MKLKWVVLGAAVVLAGGVYVMKHFSDDKKDFIPFADNKSENNYNGYAQNVSETDFDETDFLM